jgi:hypothetical protein
VKPPRGLSVGALRSITRASVADWGLLLHWGGNSGKITPFKLPSSVVPVILAVPTVTLPCDADLHDTPRRCAAYWERDRNQVLSPPTIKDEEYRLIGRL